MRRLVGSVEIMLGILMAANGIIAGPNAFISGMRGVIYLVLGGSICIAAGAWTLLAAGKMVKGGNDQGSGVFDPSETVDSQGMDAETGSGKAPVNAGKE
jgi:hypothetical protein